jgi:hypothetical protein
VVETLRAELGDGAPVTVWGGRRLDLTWDYYVHALPPNRVFLIPERDSFEDAKASAWRQLGERVYRVDVDDLPKVSGTMVRERIASGGSLTDLLCPSTVALLRADGYLRGPAG